MQVPNTTTRSRAARHTFVLRGVFSYLRTEISGVGWRGCAKPKPMSLVEKHVVDQLRITGIGVQTKKEHSSVEIRALQYVINSRTFITTSSVAIGCGIRCVSRGAAVAHLDVATSSALRRGDATAKGELLRGAL